MTATIAAVAGGGLALAFHDSSPGPAKKCGLVPCAAALPASVRSSGTGLASAPATAGPRASTPSSAAPSPARPVSAEPVSAPERLSSPSPVASSAGHAVSADHAVGVGYQITADRRRGGVHGQLVIANHGSAPVSGWRVTVVLPGDTGYQVHERREPLGRRRPGHGGGRRTSPQAARGHHLHRPGHHEHPGPVHVQ